MAKYSESLEAQKKQNEAQEAALTDAATSVEGLVSDIDTLNKTIADLQNSAGQVTAEDQTTIDLLQSQGAAITLKAQGISDALRALDAKTSPAS